MISSASFEDKTSPTPGKERNFYFIFTKYENIRTLIYMISITYNVDGRSNPGKSIAVVVVYIVLTGLHEVTHRTVSFVLEYFLVQPAVGATVAAQESLPCPLRAVVELIGLLDPVVDEESKHVRGEVERQNDEVDPVVVIQQVDAHPRAVHLFAFRPDEACMQDS